MFHTLAFMLFAGLCASPAFATSRTVYFTATGKNYSPNGLATRNGTTQVLNVNTTCRIVISNPSQTTQNYSLTYNVQQQNVGATTWTNSKTQSCGTSPCSGSIPAGNSVTILFTYADFPTGTANATQVLRCAGSITATDPGSSPGFLFASGTLVTFTESSGLETDAVTGGTAVFGGSAVYSQIPIVINRAKPF